MAEETKETASKKTTAKKKAAPKKAGAKKSTAKKAPKKKASAAKAKASGASVNMTEFILSFPPEVKPKEIVEKWAARGLTGLKTSYASTVRSKARDKGTWPVQGQSNGTPAPSDSSDVESEFMRILNKLGTARAKKLFALYAAARGEG